MNRSKKIKSDLFCNLIAYFMDENKKDPDNAGSLSFQLKWLITTI